jgi:TadE-like protein
MTPISKIWHRMREAGHGFVADCRALAAVEFAFILPLMLVLFFGTVEFSSGVAIDRKVTLIARTLSDITSQATGTLSPPVATINDTYLQNVFTASISIVKPYDDSPTIAQISEIYVDSSRVARIQWSKGATIGAGASQATLGASTHSAGDIITIPSQLLVPQTYLIFSEVSYRYVPTIGYVMVKTGVNLSDVAYTRPRQSTCIVYNNAPALQAGSCPLP